MRKFTISTCFVGLIATLLLASGSASAQMGQSLWKFSNPKTFGFNVTAAEYYDDNLAIVAGDGGGIARTTDGGATWQYFGWFELNGNTLIKPTFNDIHFISGTRVVVVGTNGVMLRSNDAGITWSRMNNPFAESGTTINSVWFTNLSVGYIGGEPIGGSTTGFTTLYKTTNGGGSWTLEPNLPNLPAQRFGNGTSSPFYYDSSRPKTIQRIIFLNENLGYASGARGLLWKYDGTGWKNYSFTNYDLGLDTLVGTGRPVSGPQVQNYWAMYPVDDTLVALASWNNNYFIRASTSGSENNVITTLTDQTATTFNSSNRQNIAKYADGTLVMAPGSSGSYTISSDSAKTWYSSRVYPDASGYEGLGIFAVAVSPGNRMIAAGRDGVVADSSAGMWRRNYTNSNVGAGFNVVDFPNTMTGMVAGGFGNIAFTEDGGQTWLNRSNATDAAQLVSYYAIRYVHPDTAYLSTSNGAVRVSYDKGQNWDLLFQDDTTGSKVFFGMDWINSQKGWVAGRRGSGATAGTLIFRTSDGGLTWDTTKLEPRGTLSPSLSVNSLDFVNENVGFLVANRGRVYKTTDGGVTWTLNFEVPAIAPTTTPPTISAVHALDENVIWIGGWTNGGLNTVWRTSDGGANWTNAMTYELGSAFINGIVAYDSLQAFALRNSGLAYYTADGGKNWNIFSMPGTSILQDGLLINIDPNCGEPVCQKMWVVGTNGNIMEFGSEKILPLTLSQLTGAIKDDGNQLFWAAYDQGGVKYFEVETSPDGQKFLTISDKIESTGRFTDAYKWLHEQPASGANYYRVKATEKSGKIVYTNVVKLVNNADNNWKYFVQNNTLSVFNTSVEKGNVNFRVMNMAGQAIATKAVQHPGGAINQTIQLPVGTNGVQVLQIFEGEQSQSFKVLVNK